MPLHFLCTSALDLTSTRLTPGMCLGSFGRQGNGKYMVNDIDPNLCTHIIYAFAVLDSSKLVIKPHDSWADIDNRKYEDVSC